jgi:hypothetical protein
MYTEMIKEMRGSFFYNAFSVTRLESKEKWEDRCQPYATSTAECGNKCPYHA